MPLIDIHDKLIQLIKKMYQNANAHYILVNTYTSKAFWSHTDKGCYKSFNLQHLLDALEIILNNTYIKFGQRLFLQTKGNASPLIADLYHSWLEYQYLSKFVTKISIYYINLNITVVTSTTLEHQMWKISLK